MSASTALIVLPLLAAILFTISALLLKRSSEFGPGIWRTTFVCNWISGILFCALLFFGGPPIQWKLLWQPLCIALCLFAGLLTQFLALEKGDVSVAVPVLGLKVIGVAMLTPFLTDDHVDARLWIAAVLCFLGIVLLNRKHEGRRPHNIGITLLAAGFTAIAFAMFDVLVQRWGPAWGVGRLLPLIYIMNAVLSFALVPKFKEPLSSLSVTAWKWLVPAGIFLGLQAILFVGALAVYGKATTANVIYASRGLLSVVFVWAVGHWFGNTERSLGAGALSGRLFGAALILSAIVLVVTR